jgi:hypothetical protein
VYPLYTSKFRSVPVCGRFWSMALHTTLHPIPHSDIWILFLFSLHHTLHTSLLYSAFLCYCSIHWIASLYQTLRILFIWLSAIIHWCTCQSWMISMFLSMRSSMNCKASIFAHGLWCKTCAHIYHMAQCLLNYEGFTMKLKKLKLQGPWLTQAPSKALGGALAMP